MQFSADLSNGTLSIENLYTRIKGGKSAIIDSTSGKTTSPNVEKLRIIAMNAPTRIEIEVTKDNFVIGKKAEVCDGIIGFNKMISRSHCKISKKGSQYIVIDLQSANGTYVNNVRLQPNQPSPIKNGDVIRLANSDFQVRIE